MNEELKLISEIVPDVLETLQNRYNVLRNVYWMAPVGRRTLALRMGITERVLRTETDFLKNLQLLETSKSGMTLTKHGEEVYHGLEELMDKLQGNQQKEKQLEAYFNIRKCIVVAGDSDKDEKVLKSFGQAVTEILLAQLPNGENIIAVMGGTTMAAVAANMTTIETSQRHNVFVPARGGIGESVNIQANSVSAKMAQKTGGAYRALYVPEQVSPETYNSLLQEPSVQRVLELIQRANCVVHGIGKALHMAARRGMTAEQLAMLKKQNAVAESFGYFFDNDGNVVYKIPRIGLQLKDLQAVSCIVAVAGGKSKAKAIHSYMKNAPSNTCLITDEGAINEILRGVTL